MINDYQRQGLDESHCKHENQVYDDLSSFMQLFKKILIAIQDIAFNHQKQINYQLPQQKLKAISKTLEVLMHKYAQMSGLFRIQIRTFQRFICRLIETIGLYQLKYQNNNSAGITFITNTLSEIQSIIKENQSIYHFVKFIKAIKSIVDKFSQMGISDLGYDMKRDASSKNKINRRFKILDKIDSKMIRFKQNVKQGKVNQLGGLCQSEQDEVDDENAKLQVISQTKSFSLPFSQSINTDLQKRFDLYKGLQLDYSSFKSSYFSAKSDTQEFYKEYLQRNLQISRLMKTYHDDFQLFKKKKIFRNHRKIISNKNPANLSQEKQRNHKVNFSQVIETQRFPHKDQFQKKTVVVYKQISEQMQREQSLKNSYKMNNIYLTFGKKPIKNPKNIRNYPNITPNILKGKQEASNYYFNQSFCPKKDLKITQSIDFSKIVFDMRQGLRMKTSPNKNISIETNLYPYKQIQQIKKSLKQENQIFLGNKKRYLQVDCTSKKQISLNKIILTGSINAKHLRLNKINQDKGRNILF